jgi:hypothetical protein
MGFKDWVRKHLGWFDRQIENYPRATPATPAPPRPPVTKSDLDRSAAAHRTQGRRTTPPAPPAAPSRARHRLGEPQRRRPDSDTDIDPAFGQPLTSAAPYWIDQPAPHDHRHHGHSAAAEHRSEDNTSSGYTAHHSHDSGGWGGHSHGSHDSGGHHGGSFDSGSSSFDSGSSGGFDGGGSSCGG